MGGSDPFIDWRWLSCPARASLTARRPSFVHSGPVVGFLGGQHGFDHQEHLDHHRHDHAHTNPSPAGKLADAELHFHDGVLSGLKLIGFSI